MGLCFASYLGRGRVRNSATLLPLAAAAVLVMTGCSAAASAGAVIIVRDNANGKTVHVPAGDRVELILSSTYWMVHGKSAPAVLRQDGPTRLLPRPKSCSRIPGLGCIPVKTSFTALAAGKAVITASRTSCGEARRCVGNQGRFMVTVVVVK